jgi:DNA invertase Pin-like site-specific DNA recombinase
MGRRGARKSSPRNPMIAPLGDWRSPLVARCDLRSVISYIRVSTSQRGRSGLGIEAQWQTLVQFARAEGYTVAREFVEVETGKGTDALDRRPQPTSALATARKLRCHVAVAKLDRLSRDVHFISDLMRTR